ncbi:MAG: hypothetical protein AAF394_15005 [Planctomycetota bacterium]
MHPLLEMISQPKNTEAEEPPQAAAEQLRKLLSDVDAFLTHYCDRLDRKVEEIARQAQTRPHTPDRQSAPVRTEQADSSAAMRELAEQQELWEAQKEQEELQIQQQLGLLQEAWLRLEEEQRSFLQTKEGFAATQGGTRTSSTPAAAPATEQTSTTRTQPIGRPSKPVSANNAAYSSSAIDEFQRLKQEIHNLRPQNPRG